MTLRPSSMGSLGVLGDPCFMEGPGLPKEPKRMAQDPKTESIGNIESMILAILWRSREF